METYSVPSCQVIASCVEYAICIVTLCIQDLVLLCEPGITEKVFYFVSHLIIMITIVMKIIEILITC